MLQRDATFRTYAGRASSLPAPARPARGRVTDAVLFVDAIPHGWDPDFAARDTDIEVPATSAVASEVEFR